MARGRGLLVVFALAAGFGCGREAVPAELIGRWTSDDPRYADRSLAIGTEQITFGADDGLAITYRMQGIERETNAEAGTLYRLFYDAPSEPERELQVRALGPGELHIENHGERWTRAGVVTGG
jgi:hypothetical protein